MIEIKGHRSEVVSVKIMSCYHLLSSQQEGILYAHASIWAVEAPQRHFLRIVYVQYQHLRAIFWSRMTCIGCYVPQTCSSTYRGIATMKVSLL